MRYIIIGDIHGCYNELLAMINELNVTTDDVLISIGDIIHKGPMQLECVDFMINNSSEYVLGNHEEKQLRWEIHHKKELSLGAKNPMSHVDDYVSLPSDRLDWLNYNSRLFIQITAGEKLYTLVHGGIEPSLKAMPKSSSFQNSSRRERNLLRTRYVNPSGHMVMLGSEQAHDVYWAETYDGRFGHVIFGHQPFLNRKTPREYSYCTGIDLGCVYGNALCAAIIDGSDGALSYHTVNSFDKYAFHRKELGSMICVPV